MALKVFSMIEAHQLVDDTLARPTITPQLYLLGFSILGIHSMHIILINQAYFAVTAPLLIVAKSKAVRFGRNPPFIQDLHVSSPGNWYLLSDVNFCTSNRDVLFGFIILKEYTYVLLRA